MNMKIWMKKASQEQRDALAAEANTSVGYLWQLAGGHRRAGVDMAKALVKASIKVTPDSALTLDGLRPDIWGLQVA